MAERKKLVGICRKLGRICFYLFLFDCAATGAGRYLTVGPFTPRIVLAGLIVLFAAIPFFASVEKQIKNPVNWLVLIFLFYVIFEAYRGQMFGNDQDVLITDVKGFVYMLLIPAVPVLVYEKKHLRRAADTVIAGCFVQSAFIVTANALLTGFSASFYKEFIETAWELKWGWILAVRYDAFRFFCNSSIYLVAACVFLLYRISKAEKAAAVCGWGFLFLLDAEALLLTFTRSIYLAAGVAFILTMIQCLRAAPVKKVLLRTAVLLILLVVAVYGQEMALKQGIFQFAFARCFNFDIDAHFHIPHTWVQEKKSSRPITASGDEIREETTGGLYEIIAENPLIGKGLGATTEARNGADEYFYLDMLARMGIVGLTLYMLPILLTFLRLLKNRKRLKEHPETAAIAIGLLAFLIATYFNPWMNASLGIAWYALTVAAVWTLPDKKEGQTECAES